MISRSLPLRIRNLFQTKVADKIKKKHFILIIIFFSKIIPGNEIMLKNMIVSDRPQITL